MILAACFANPDENDVILITDDLGHVLVTTDDHRAALDAWVAGGGRIAPYVAPAQTPWLTCEAFCVALITAGIFTETEAEEAALGAWPAKFEAVLAGKSLVEKLTLKNFWRAAKTVARDAPLVADLLAFYAGTEEKHATAALADAIFAGDSIISFSEG